ncbi:Capsular glucan synthase [Lacunisphaera limnophila]|uniref:Capsular glucan synthase n=1 Tax=Lacunisphaera limnophila TaxID=1838286 RepID=A0A1D8ASU2_9BACT|nr:N-acetyl-alpha-D-glucosaminyl L-malate synthase BshA [Lacunisphaera limnophila]AOS43932.1 Capsular glucan synthase [Lacunisphaera limnophila]
MTDRALRIGITCHPSVGGSGILASELGEELAQRGHEVHFISHAPPFRMPRNRERVHFHPVRVNDYDLFKYPDYTLPLSVKMAEVAAAHALDILHVHYAVPHATAAMLAMSMLPPDRRPRVIVTLHGTDVMLLGSDAGYGPAIKHALEAADGVTTVSQFLQGQVRTHLGFTGSVEVIPNFFAPQPPTRTRDAVRADLGLEPGEAMLLHASNLRPVKRIDLLLQTIAQIRPRESFKLVVLAGGDFTPFAAEAAKLGLTDRIVVRENVTAIEDYLNAADAALFTSELESFCLSILEAMTFDCPSAAFAVGGIPEVVESGLHGLLVPFGDTAALARAIEILIADPVRRAALGKAGRERAIALFSADRIVGRYEQYYRGLCAAKG